MNTNLTNPNDIKQAFGDLFANRTEEEQREDAAQLLSFRFLSEVERIMDERDLTRRKLAELVGTSSSYITQLFRGDRLLNIDMMARFEKALDIRFTATGSEPATQPKQKRPSRSHTPVGGGSPARRQAI